MVRLPLLGSSTPRGTVCNTGSFWKNNLTVCTSPAAIGSAVRYDIVDALLPSLIVPRSLPIEYVVGLPSASGCTSWCNTLATLLIPLATLPPPLKLSTVSFAM